VKPPSSPERTLAVILHADVVGSTRLVQQDEGLAHKRITEAFRRLSGYVSQYGGVLHEIRGDALLAEFSRASDAVAAAIAFQYRNGEENRALGDDIQPQVRIGISLGEVIVADGTVTGAGVVLAQRIEQLARPDGICITAAIHEAVPRRLPYDYQPLGLQELKGFEEEIRVWQVALKTGEGVPAADPLRVLAQTAGVSGKRTAWVVGGVVALVILGTVLLSSLGSHVWNLPDPAGKYSIAILPFDNLSGNPDDEKYSDGLSENIISALARIHQLLVVARNATFRYKNKAVLPSTIADELKVRYMLEGSLQRDGQRIRVTAQLIDTASGNHLWSETFDRELGDFFKVQDEITLRIVRSLQLELYETGSSLLTKHQTDSIEAWSKFYEGRQLFFERKRDSNRRARLLAEEVIRLDPDFAYAYNGLSWVHYMDYLFGWTEEPQKSLADSKRFNRESLNRDPQMGSAHLMLSYYAMGEKRFDEALQHAKAAVDFEPSNALLRSGLASNLLAGGEYRKALEHAAAATRIHPKISQAGLHSMWAHYLLGEYEQAETWAREMLDRYPVRARVVLIAALTAQGRTEEARKEVDQVMKEEPDFKASSRKLPTLERFRDPSIREAFLHQIVAAGLPE